MLLTTELERSVDQRAAGKTVSPSGRRVIFISHATPQDNVFAGWLAAQLAIAGYEVWCDVTKLLGGEAWWSDIDQAIDAATFRVLFVSTLEANRKSGTLRELRLAFETQKKHGLNDFVIPLKIDEFPFASMQKSLQGLNCVRFDETWATGLSSLLKLLEREGAPKSPAAGPGCVTEWYERSIDLNRRFVVSRERCTSNWFPLTLPAQIRFHKFKGPSDSLPGIADALSFPHKAQGEFLITFAPLPVVEEAIGPHFSATKTCDTAAFIEDGFGDLDIHPFDATNIVSYLVRQAGTSQWAPANSLSMPWQMVKGHGSSSTTSSIKTGATMNPHLGSAPIASWSGTRAAGNSMAAGCLTGSGTMPFRLLLISTHSLALP